MKRIYNYTGIFFLVLVSIVACTATKGQKNTIKNYKDLNWKEVATKMPDDWYGSPEALMVADSVLKYQTAIGGWPKNSGFHKGVNQEEMARIQSSGIGATFDNGATTTEMIFLTKVYAKAKNENYYKAFDKALNYILAAQYKNGGWPQFFPFRNGKSISYNSHITYNDNAMVNVMNLLKDIAENAPFYAALPITQSMREKAGESFKRGVDCILKTQIRVNSQPTVWCAQHDENTFLPADARAYELASFSGQESAGIVLLLMEIENPSAEIITAVEAAVKWFNNYKIAGVKVVNQPGADGKKNMVVVPDATAPSIWARFYDLETGKPFFCDRDGIKKYSLAEIGDERRNGYSWYTTNPEKVLLKYAEWKKKWTVFNN
jgi:pectinesterase